MTSVLRNKTIVALPDAFFNLKLGEFCQSLCPELTESALQLHLAACWGSMKTSIACQRHACFRHCLLCGMDLCGAGFMSGQKPCWL